MAPDREWRESGVRLVLVTPKESTLVLDGIVDSPESALGAVGWPIAIEVERAETAWLDAALEHMLSGWAEDARVVTVELAAVGPRPEARLVSGQASVRAHLVRVA